MYEPLKRRDSFVISSCWSHKSYLLFFFLFLLDDDGVVWLDENLFLCIYSTSLTQKKISKPNGQTWSYRESIIHMHTKTFNIFERKRGMDGWGGMECRVHFCLFKYQKMPFDVNTEILWWSTSWLHKIKLCKDVIIHETNPYFYQIFIHTELKALDDVSTHK